ncbi:MAG: murein hydrolase activator EnvC family protein [Methylococcaceae bacterium]
MRKKLVFYFLLGLLTQSVHSGMFDDDNGADAVSSPVDSSEDAEQKNTLEALLADVEKRYGETAALLRTLHRQIEQKRQVLDTIRHDIQTYQRQLDKESKELSGQIRSAYMMGQQEKLKLMLNQQDPALSSRMMVYYNYLNKKRLTKLATIQESVKLLDELDKQRQAEADSLESQLKQKHSEQAVLNAFRKQRNELLNNAANEQQLEQLQISENKLKNLLASLPNTAEAEVSAEDLHKPESVQSVDETKRVTEDFPKLEGNFSSLKGKLPWPVRGKLAEKIGSLQSESIPDGVLINAKEGTEIHAVSKGRVKYSDWFKNYGLLMIVEHDDGYMTLYAFNQSLYKQVGESVEAGEVIASVGQSGGRTLSGLYFGIRKQGEPVDPLVWCKN